MTAVLFRWHWLLLLSCFAGWILIGESRGEWSTYRGDQQRSGCCDVDISELVWQPAWISDQFARPQPAWPAPARASLWQNLDSISPRQREDLADVPLIVADQDGNGHVVIGSSGGDCVSSLDPIDGSTQWSIPLPAPVRFAPIIKDSKVFFGCDDGIVRSVDLQSGKELWRYRVGPGLPFIVGNGRVISPHPIRTSLLFVDDILIAHAGLFPSQGVYAVALDSRTGQMIWRRRITSSPQGYLLSASSTQVVVPTGRAQPYLMDVLDGSVSGTLPSPGGSFCMMSSGRVYTGPGNQNQIEAAVPGARRPLMTFQSQAIAACDGFIWTANGQQLTCFREEELSGEDSQPRWRVPCRLAATLIVANGPVDKDLIVAGENKVHVYDALDGHIKSELEVPDPNAQLVHIAVFRKHTVALIVATATSGKVYAWKGLTESDTSLKLQAEWSESASKRIIESPKTDPFESTPLFLGVKSEQILSSLASPVGLGLIAGVSELQLVDQILDRTKYKLVVVAKDRQQELAWRQYFLSRGQYGERICVWPSSMLSEVSLQRGMFDLVAIDVSCCSGLNADELCGDGGIVAQVETVAKGEQSQVQLRRITRSSPTAWRHQYASPSNTASVNEPAFDRAAGFRLRWFGGLGPRQIPDRHLRGAAPLVCGASLVVHGDGCLIGVDPANGFERWQIEMPEGAMRYVMPYDGGYSCFSELGDDFFTAAGSEIWRLKPTTGEIKSKIALPAEFENQYWGYLAESGGDLFATVMDISAPRYSQDRVLLRQSFVNDDYNSDRPLVCSRHLLRVRPTGDIIWKRRPMGVIPHSSIALDGERRRILFVEGYGNSTSDSMQARFTTSQILERGSLVCLDTTTGEPVWDRPLNWPEARNMLYTLVSGDSVVLVSSSSQNDRAVYSTKVFDLENGNLVWEKEHVHVRRGLFHGEQVHHPVALRLPDGRTALVVEPYIVDLASGEAITPPGMQDDWGLSRPGHSCGTMTGAGSCLFFRADNPTVFNLASQRTDQQFTKLSPSRPSCWINMVPAAGQLFIPEGSASCVCQYSLQTSMAFEPIGQAELDRQFLPDVLPEERESLE